ncbi:MAG: hypothetical protein IKR88_08220 [Bacteroidales bacterium]|nr:hypothetical protein [Bacteroidales bacterium]
MEQNNELSARQSLDLITETLNRSRKEITRVNGKYFILWGILMTVFSLVVCYFWRISGKAQWNILWFAMPLVGYPFVYHMSKKDEKLPSNMVSKIIKGIWTLYGIFACSMATVCMVIASTFTETSSMGVTPALVLLFGIAESISGIVLKNWFIIIGGWIIGIGGVIIYYLSGVNAEQMLIFAFAGIILALTGVIVKRQNN